MELNTKEEVTKWLENGPLNQLVTMPEDLYHASPGLSQSKLQNIVEPKTPADYRYAIGHPRKPTASQILGTAAHIAILEPDTFNDRVTIAPTVNKRTKAGKEELAEFEAANRGKVILSEGDYNAALQMRDAAHRNKNMEWLLKGSVFEKSLFQRDSRGQLIRGRIDALNLEHNFILDVKTTRGADYWQFRHSVMKYKYHMQAAFYCDLAKDVTGVEITDYFICAIEKFPPFKVKIYQLSRRDISTGREMYLKALEDVWKYTHADYWPGYDDEIEVLRLPDYDNEVDPWDELVKEE